VTKRAEIWVARANLGDLVKISDPVAPRSQGNNEAGQSRTLRGENTQFVLFSRSTYSVELQFNGLVVCKAPDMRLSFLERFFKG